jgi:hypothetical protein
MGMLGQCPPQGNPRRAGGQQTMKGSDATVLIGKQPIKFNHFSSESSPRRNESSSSNKPQPPLKKHPSKPEY